MGFDALGQRLAAGIALVVLVAGCSSTPAASTSKTLVTAAVQLPSTMDPCNIATTGDSDVLPEIYGFGVNFKQVALSGTGNSGQGDDTVDGEKGVIPGVFESWDVSADATVFTLHLRHGIIDSFGNELKAADVQWELDRVNNNGCSFVTANMDITDVKKQVAVLDDYTLKVTLASPDPIFLRVMTVNSGMFFGAEARKHTTTSDPWANDWMKTNAPAIGPYKIQTFSPGVEVILVRNPNYNLGPKPYYDKVIYRFVPQDSNRLALIESGQAQTAETLTQDQWNEAAKNPNTYLKCNTAIEFVAAFINVNKKSPVSNQQFRQALAYATPYDDIIKSAYGGLASRLYGMAPSDYPGYVGDSQYPISATDLAKAKQLLNSAGYSGGATITVMINTDEPELERSAVLLQNSFKQIGVTLNIDAKPSSVFYDALDNRTYGDMTLERTFALVPDYGYHSKLFLKPAPAPNVNWSGWTDPEFTQLLHDQATLPDGPDRNAKFARMQQIFNQQVPWLSIANVPTCQAFSKSVSGYHWHTVGAVWYPDMKPA